jgi:hypothetical protein
VDSVPEEAMVDQIQVAMEEVAEVQDWVGRFLFKVVVT